MKNTTNLMIALMLLLALWNANSLKANPIVDNNGLIVKIAPAEEGRAFELRMANLGKQFTKVKVMDVWGYTLLSQMLTKKDGYSSRIDLQNLPNGDYLLRVEHPSGNFNHAFKLGTESVTFFNTVNKDAGFVQLTGQKESAVILPNRFTTSPNSLNVQLQELGGQEVKAHICNLAGKVYLRKKFKNADSLNEQFATEKLPEGEFLLVILSEKNTVIQPFSKTEKGLKLKNTLISKTEVPGEVEIYSQR